MAGRVRLRRFDAVLHEPPRGAKLAPATGAGSRGAGPKPGRRGAVLVRRGRRAPRARPAWVTPAVILAASLVAGGPRLAIGWGRPQAARPGTVRPVWTVPAAFVHPGQEVEAPVAGRLMTVSGSGMVSAGAVLAQIRPQAAPTLSAPPVWALWTGTGPRVVTTAYAPGGLATLLCRWRGCTAARAAAPALRPVRAAAAGWFWPGWDALALTSLSADSDLPPGVLTGAVLPAAVGAVVPAGAPLGVLGTPWGGRWLCVLPAVARSALAASGSVRVAWGGHPAQSAQLAATGPAVDGAFVAVFTTTAPGVPAPPPRTPATVALPAVRGVLVPETAVRPTAAGASVWRVEPGRRIVRQAVRVLGTAGGWTAVRGIPAGASILRNPWLLARVLSGAR